MYLPGGRDARFMRGCFNEYRVSTCTIKYVSCSNGSGPENFFADAFHGRLQKGIKMNKKVTEKSPRTAQS